MDRFDVLTGFTSRAVLYETYRMELDGIAATMMKSETYISSSIEEKSEIVGTVSNALLNIMISQISAEIAHQVANETYNEEISAISEQAVSNVIDRVDFTTFSAASMITVIINEIIGQVEEQATLPIIDIVDQQEIKTRLSVNIEACLLHEPATDVERQ